MKKIIATSLITILLFSILSINLQARTWWYGVTEQGNGYVWFDNNGGIANTSYSGNYGVTGGFKEVGGINVGDGRYIYSRTRYIDLGQVIPSECVTYMNIGGWFGCIQIYASLDGINWTFLASESNTQWKQYIKEFPSPNLHIGNIRYLKAEVQKINGGDNGIVDAFTVQAIMSSVPTIAATAPLNNTTFSNSTTSVNFTANVSDLICDSLTVKLYIDNVLQQTKTITGTKTTQTATFTQDISNLTDSHTWYMSVTNAYNETVNTSTFNFSRKRALVFTVTSPNNNQLFKGTERPSFQVKVNNLYDDIKTLYLQAYTNNTWNNIKTINNVTDNTTNTFSLDENTYTTLPFYYDIRMRFNIDSSYSQEFKISKAKTFDITIIEPVNNQKVNQGGFNIKVETSTTQ